MLSLDSTSIYPDSNYTYASIHIGRRFFYMLLNLEIGLIIFGLYNILRNVTVHTDVQRRELLNTNYLIRDRPSYSIAAPVVFLSGDLFEPRANTKMTTAVYTFGGFLLFRWANSG
jgi:hypothetical protein